MRKSSKFILNIGKIEGKRKYDRINWIKTKINKIRLKYIMW